jgi:hypothetical protein
MVSEGLLLGLIPDSSNAEAAINDCVEAGMSERHISLVMADETTARAIIDDGGPLRGAAPATVADVLERAGVSPADAQAYAGGVAAGQALIALDVDDDTRDGATEVLQDHRADRIAVFPVRS